MTRTGSRNRARRFVFAGGGSGGHLTPSLAIAGALLELDADLQVVFLTSGRDIDRTVLSHSAITADPRCEVVPLPLTGPPRPDWTGAAQLWTLGRSVLKCLTILKQHPTDVVLATGAFAAVPGLIAAKRLKIPTALFEANVIPGRVNRWWARHAAMKFSGWPVSGTGAELAFENVGMPIRRDDDDVSNDPLRRRQILIVGGSQGSQRLNEIVGSVLTRLDLPDEWSVLHQTGDRHHATTARTASSDAVRTVPFIDDLVRELRRSEIVISRAGAVTLGELAAAGRPAILIPMESSAESHQFANARCLETQGAAVVVRESDLLAGEQLREILQRLIEHPAECQAMSTAMKSLHRANAGHLIARRLMDLAEAC